MSDSARPRVAYGFNLGEEDGLPPTLMGLINLTNECEDGDWPIQLVDHGYFDYPNWFVAIRETVQRGLDWGSVVEIDIMPVSDASIEAARSFWISHGLKWQEPKWCAVAYYG